MIRSIQSLCLNNNRPTFIVLTLVGLPNVRLFDIIIIVILLWVVTNALRDPMGRVSRSLGTGGLDTGSRGLGTGRGSTGARYRASVLGNGTKF